jgi:hypothetical protein
MNAKFASDFPLLTAVAVDSVPPSDEESGITGWDNYASDVAEILGCNTEDLRYLNSEILNNGSEQDEFTALQGWCERNTKDVWCSTVLDSCIDGEFETLNVEAYFYQTEIRKPFFVRIVEFAGDIPAYYFPVQFLTDDAQNFHPAD